MNREFKIWRITRAIPRTGNAANRSRPSTTTPPISVVARARLEELLLGVRDDLAVRGRVRDAREHEAVLDLRVLEERLVRLVDGARDDLARAARARAGAARVRQVEALLLRLVEDVHVLGALKG